MKITKNGFTLIELLVVISIIAVLMAVLMPVLGKARSQARTVMCGSNLGQFSVALRTYAADNNNEYLRHEWLPAEAYPYWFARISPYISVVADNKTSKLMRCPSGLAIKDYGDEFFYGWIGTDYGLQDIFSSNQTGVKTMMIDNIVKPAEFAAFFDFYFGSKVDGQLPAVTGAIYNVKFYLLVDNSMYKPLNPIGKVFRHGDCINAIYLDGHSGKAALRQKVWQDIDSPSSLNYDPSGDSYMNQGKMLNR